MVLANDPTPIISNLMPIRYLRHIELISLSPKYTSDIYHISILRDSLRNVTGYCESESETNVLEDSYAQDSAFLHRISRSGQPLLVLLEVLRAVVSGTARAEFQWLSFAISDFTTGSHNGE